MSKQLTRLFGQDIQKPVGILSVATKSKQSGVYLIDSSITK